MGIDEITLTDWERDNNVFLLHSDLWPQEDGTVAWTADHPCGWQTGGDAPDMATALTAVEDAAIFALPEGDRPEGYDTTRVVRVSNDG